jgi:hypothetical protein
MIKLLFKFNILLISLGLVTSIFSSCKQDTKINLPELKEGYYKFEILEKYVYPPDSTDYLKYSASWAQIYSNPGFLIKKTNERNEFTACITYKDIISYPECSPVNYSLKMIHINNDSIYLQNPWFLIRGSYNGYVPRGGSESPTVLVDSTLKYQVQISGLQLNNNNDIQGYWHETVRCLFSTIKDGQVTFDSISASVICFGK